MIFFNDLGSCIFEALLHSLKSHLFDLPVLYMGFLNYYEFISLEDLSTSSRLSFVKILDGLIPFNTRFHTNINHINFALYSLLHGSEASIISSASKVPLFGLV